MDSAKELANEMLRSINIDRDGFLYSVGKGFIKLPTNIYYIGYDFMDSDNRGRNKSDKMRMANMIKNGQSITKGVEDIVKIIINEYLSFVNIDKIKKMAIGVAGEIAGSVAFSQITGVSLGGVISSRLVGSIAVGGVIGGILTVGSEVSRAIYVSRKLEDRYYSLYEKLRNAGDLDLLYFLIEDKIRPFEDACLLHRRNSKEFDEVCNYFFGGLGK